jgi:transposase
VTSAATAYATAVAAGLPDARLVVDHFHVIRLANAALDEVRRRTQQTVAFHQGPPIDVAVNSRINSEAPDRARGPQSLSDQQTRPTLQRGEPLSVGVR